MTNTPHSALLTATGCNINTLDAAAFAAALDCALWHIPGDTPTLDDIIACEPLAGDPVLVQGTGNLNFDLCLAAALGLPVLMLVDAPGRHVALAIAEAETLGAVVAATFTEKEATAELRTTLDIEVTPVMSPAVFEHWLLGRAKKKQAHIVLPEGNDDRILAAADQLLARGICQLTILGDPDAIHRRELELDLDLSKATLSNPLTDPKVEEFAQQFTELRKSKGMTLEKARETMKDISYYATMMIHNDLADGMVSGAANTTAHTIKPSFQIIKTMPNTSVVSSIFLMVLRGQLWAFGDCAVNPNPTAQQLGEIAVVSAHTAAKFGIDPRVAILSYSTGTSGDGPDVDRAAAAVQAARELDPELHIDGPLQFDAAVDPVVAAKKLPESTVAGNANVFIFPDLEAGNIGYKTAQRTGHALAVGPIMQGLKKPVNDLSRGATVADIVNTVAITAIQVGGA